jgi:CBS domain-containing protein
MKIRDVIAEKGRHVVTVWPEKPLEHIPRIFDDRSIASVVVVDHSDFPVGIISDRGIMRALARRGSAALKLPVADVMEHPPVTCTPEDTVNDVLGLMTEKRVRHVLVIHNGEMVGIVSIGDLVKFRVKDADFENKVLRDMALTKLAIC